MAFRYIFLSIACAVSVNADLTCFEWGLILAPVGLLCHFKHDTFDAAEKATVAGAVKVAEDVKSAAVFEIKHHPLVLGYDWTEAAVENGTAAANRQLGAQLRDEVRVGIGMGKEVANTAVNIYELTHWNDLTYCIMTSAGAAAAAESRAHEATPTLITQLGPAPLQTSLPGHQFDTSKRGKAKRATALSGSQAQSILDKCAAQKFRQLAKPAIFNITDPDEKIGSTLTQLATFFVPVGPEAEGAKIALNGVDLAIPGSEGAGRIFQKVGEEAEHFASEADALAVKEKLAEPAWVKENCNQCRAPATSNLSRRAGRHAQRSALTRRGAVMSLCCGLPSVIPETKGDFELYTSGSSDKEKLLKSLPYYDSANYKAEIAESSLIPPPKLKKWADGASSTSDVLKDLDQYDTAVVAWSPETIKAISSRDLFKLLRRAFEPKSDADRALAEELQVTGRGLAARLSFNSESWAYTPSKLPDMQRIQSFTEAAKSQIKLMLRDLRGLSEDEVDDLQATIDFFYIPPTKAAINNPDSRGLHIDTTTFQLGIADQPGLIVQKDEQLFRLPIASNGWHLLKCSRWGRVGSKDVGELSFSRHTVFGPEIVKNGRVSIIVNVF